MCTCAHTHTRMLAGYCSQFLGEISSFEKDLEFTLYYYVVLTALK